MHAKQALDDVNRALVDAGQIDVLPQFDRVRGRLDKLIGRIRGAMRGYSGWFDLVVGNGRALPPVRPGWTGTAIPGHTVGIVDESGRELPAGESGSIAFHGQLL